jgi:hypothetical protein
MTAYILGNPLAFNATAIQNAIGIAGRQNVHEAVLAALS